MKYNPTGEASSPGVPVVDSKRAYLGRPAAPSSWGETTRASENSKTTSTALQHYFVSSRVHAPAYARGLAPRRARTLLFLPPGRTHVCQPDVKFSECIVSLCAWEGLRFSASVWWGGEGKGTARHHTRAPITMRESQARLSVTIAMCSFLRASRARSSRRVAARRSGRGRAWRVKNNHPSACHWLWGARGFL